MSAVASLSPWSLWSRSALVLAWLSICTKELFLCVVFLWIELTWFYDRKTWLCGRYILWYEQDGEGKCTGRLDCMQANGWAAPHMKLKHVGSVERFLFPLAVETSNLRAVTSCQALPVNLLSSCRLNIQLTCVDFNCVIRAEKIF